MLICTLVFRRKRCCRRDHSLHLHTRPAQVTYPWLQLSSQERRCRLSWGVVKRDQQVRKRISEKVLAKIRVSRSEDSQAMMKAELGGRISSPRLMLPGPYRHEPAESFIACRLSQWMIQNSTQPHTSYRELKTLTLTLNPSSFWRKIFEWTLI
jgi:hypothetical protein